MHTIYNLVSGPLVWASVILFLGGSIGKLIYMGVLTKKKDNVVLAYASPYYGARSILHWITPYASENMRRHPYLTAVSFIFHICVLLLPIFVLGHVVLIDEAWGVSWPHLPEGTADMMTLLVIASCVFFLVRRLTAPEVKFLTGPSDFFILLMVAAPFITGFWTYHHWAGFQVAGILHILSGEILLAAIPFTRLSHMIFFPFTRAYMGSEFGGVRHARDW